MKNRDAPEPAPSARAAPDPPRHGGSADPVSERAGASPGAEREGSGEPLQGHDGLRRENEALRERISRLSAASLRINETLDLATVLHEVVECACALTAARYGIIATVDAAGRVRDFVSTGVTEDEHRRMAEWVDGPRLVAHLRDLPPAVRTADVGACVRDRGISTDLLPSQTLVGMALSHRGERVGYFYLAGKEGGPEFTGEDEEVLALFASQAAAAIANARTYRDEQRARADLQALVDTSPVGVVVFEAGTGAPLSFNRAAERIVETLRTSGEPPEQLLRVMTCRLADGREIALDQFPLFRELTSAETMRSEEIELSVPDGRSVATLVSATPIHAADGTVESVVVTMQDLAPLEELERLRAEFLDMVSHELRAPLTSIKGAAATLMETSSTLDRAEMREFFRIIVEQTDHMRGLISDLLDAGRIDTGTLSVAPEPTEVATLVDRARNTFLSGGSGHNVLIDLAPELPRVMADRRRIVQVLNNLFVNAARYSPEPSPIRVAAARDGVHVAISVRDEGRGVAPERLPHLFRKYARAGTEDRERGLGGGLGLAICKGLVEAHGGRIRAESGGHGQGARFIFTIPVAEETGGGAATVAGDRRRGPVRAGDEPPRVLVVDDDPQTLRYVRDALTDAGYVVLVTGDHRELSRLIETERPDLVLLDLMLPDTDGIELMRRVPELADRPVIFISAYGRDETIARALESGAADYIVKPFSPTELAARVRAALRGRAKAEPFRLGDLVILYDERQVTVAGRPVNLTATEYELLRMLSVEAGRVLTYDALKRRIWGARNSDDTNLVRTFVRQLRRKLGDDPKEPTWIFNQRGVGYRMARPGEP